MRLAPPLAPCGSAGAAACCPLRARLLAGAAAASASASTSGSLAAALRLRLADLPPRAAAGLAFFSFSCCWGSVSSAALAPPLAA